MNLETEIRAVPRAQRGQVHHEPETYGHSARGVPLEFYGPRGGPVDVLLMAAMHGDECESTVVLSEALRCVQPRDMANPVILGVNPDGILRGTRGNARGVDLNRNWPAGNFKPGTVLYRGHGQDERDIELSAGDAPASEPETQALMKLVQRLQPRAVVSLHAPLGCVEDPEASPLARWSAEQAGLPLVPSVGYPTPGSFGSWSQEQGINILTWELPDAPITELLASHVPVLRKLITGAHRAEIA